MACMATFWNVYTEIGYLLFFKIEDSKILNKIENSEIFLILGSTSLALQDHM